MKPGIEWIIIAFCSGMLFAFVLMPAQQTPPPPADPEVCRRTPQEEGRWRGYDPGHPRDYAMGGK